MDIESILVKFIRARQRECTSLLDIVSVKWMGGGDENQCFANAHSMIRSDEIDIASGWLALPFDHKNGHRQFTQHWWNYNRRLNRFFDISPDIEDGAIYIFDPDIAIFATVNNHRLKSCVPLSVVFREGQFFGLEQLSDRFQLNSLTTLTTEQLFTPYIITEIMDSVDFRETTALRRMA